MEAGAAFRYEWGHDKDKVRKNRIEWWLTSIDGLVAADFWSEETEEAEAAAQAAAAAKLANGGQGGSGALMSPASVREALGVEDVVVEDVGIEDSGSSVEELLRSARRPSPAEAWRLLVEL